MISICNKLRKENSEKNNKGNRNCKRKEGKLNCSIKEMLSDTFLEKKYDLYFIHPSICKNNYF
jgi:hypothetical protein